MSGDVVIVGAGIAGIATAYALARRRIGRIVIVDQRPPLSLTSNRPEANYRTWWPQPAMVALAERSLEIIDELNADGAEIPLDRRGYLYVSATASAAALEAVVANHPATRASGAVALSGDEVRRRWPHLAPSITAAIFVQRAGGLDTVALGQQMLRRAADNGVEVIHGELTEVATALGRIVGVDVASNDGEQNITTDVLVDAAGPFANNVARLAGTQLPIETVLRQKLVIADIDHVVPRNAPFTITLDGVTLDWTGDERTRLARTPDTARLLGPLRRGIHVKPDDTVGERALKLGWAWDQTPTQAVDGPTFPADFVRMVLLGATTIAPGLKQYADALIDGRSGIVTAHEGGFYTRAPDGMPLIGPLGPSAPTGFFVIVALAGFGAMMAAAAGELAAEWIVGEPTAATATPRADTKAAFDPRRFDDAAYLAALATEAGHPGEL